MSSIENNRKQLNRIALIAAGIAMLLTILTIPAQITPLPSIIKYASIGCAVFAGIFWIIALCVATKARGHNAVWGLTLLFPLFILVYPYLFPNETRTKDAMDR